MKIFYSYIFALLVSLVFAQTDTVVDDNGQTVVEVVTTNARGVRTTAIISTIAEQTPTQITQNQGPIGAPPRTTAEGTPFLPTPFQYTTTINGVKTVIQDTFTPTLGFPTTVSTQIPATGTILDYSEWRNQFGATATNTASMPQRWSNEGLLAFLVAGLASLLGGAWVIVS
ncbi:hypothetical protein Moror_1221 [Moniliophthora roreri MCA 2997]|uniref:Uncharacterized protein n=2 Tax=Moniliophthora roreri TaxID=221103 RepID=V2WR14_MONRO|nr:hypothetical protein Moror_1221 [Moniliophthora roreri MCA 2997]KAI3604357.1 hypothetical protein WG66_008653 [Moniliophthora roreri]